MHTARSCIRPCITLINITDYVAVSSGPKGSEKQRESSLIVCAAEYRNLMDLWVRFMAAHPLHCYSRKKKVDWSSQTPETITHSPLRSILFSQSTLVSIELTLFFFFFFLEPIKRNHYLPGPRSNCISHAM